MHKKIDFNHKTILITGGAGFIGSNLAFYLQTNFPKTKIVIFDSFRNLKILENGNPASLGHYKNLSGFLGEIICGDIKNKTDINKLEKFKFDYIFHQAAISDTRVYDQELVMQTNVNSFYDILTIAKLNKATIVYASSAATYGSLPSPQTIDIEEPDNPYGFSKLMMDRISKNFSRDNPEIKIVGLRYFNVYGPREFYKAKTASMVIQLGHQLLDGTRPRLFEGSSNIFRDFIYVEDAIQANIKACSSKTSGVFNVGTGVPRSFKDIVDILQIELNTDLKIEFFKNPYLDYQMHTEADISLTKDSLGFNPKYSLEEGIKAYIPEIIRLYGNDYK
jgi:ADP-L-glycero-D-manno-heptose 6-epimerase